MPRPGYDTPALTLRDVRKGYATGRGGYLSVLKGVSLDLQHGEVVAIVGESGSGKSTLLHLMGTLDKPDAGQVLLNGENVFALPDAQLAAFRNSHIGFVFQFHHLLPEFSALENVAMPALIGGSSKRRACELAQALLGQLALTDRAHHRPAELSGGEQQRVAVARALVNSPDLILADEPTGNLDARTADALHQEIIRLSRSCNQTFVLVTHNPVLAAACDRVLQLDGGELRPVSGTEVIV